MSDPSYTFRQNACLTSGESSDQSSFSLAPARKDPGQVNRKKSWLLVQSLGWSSKGHVLEKAGNGRVGRKVSPSLTSDDARKETDFVSKPGDEGGRDEEGEGWRDLKEMWDRSQR